MTLSTIRHMLNPTKAMTSNKRFNKCKTKTSPELVFMIPVTDRSTKFWNLFRAIRWDKDCLLLIKLTVYPKLFDFIYNTILEFMN